MKPENSFLCCFGAFGHPQMDSKSYTEAHKLAGCMFPMFKLENRPLTISISPFFKKKLSGATRKKVFLCFFGAFGHPQMDPKRCLKAHKWAGCMSQFLILPILLTESIGPFL
jgi:hypothetical protein